MSKTLYDEDGTEFYKIKSNDPQSGRRIIFKTRKGRTVTADVVEVKGNRVKVKPKSIRVTQKCSCFQFTECPADGCTYEVTRKLPPRIKVRWIDLDIITETFRPRPQRIQRMWNGRPTRHAVDIDRKRLLRRARAHGVKLYYTGPMRSGPLLTKGQIEQERQEFKRRQAEMYDRLPNAVWEQWFG